jgi:hypothetical protein
MTASMAALAAPRLWPVMYSASMPFGIEPPSGCTERPSIASVSAVSRT